MLKFSSRLRRFAGDHARQGESNVENISCPNSPSALEQYYEQFYDHERMDAVEALERFRLEGNPTKANEVDDRIIACFIFEVNVQ